MLMPLTQFAPARAKKKLDDPANTPEGLGWENKIDGERFKIHTYKASMFQGFPLTHRCDSRCISKATNNFTEKTDRVPHIMTASGLPEKSIIDCEFVSTGDEIRVEVPGVFYDKLADSNHPHTQWFKNNYQGTIPVYPHVSMTCSILGSLPDEAIRKQTEQNAWIKAYAFDMVQFECVDSTKWTQELRRTYLANALYQVDPNLMMLMPQWVNLTSAEVEKLFYLLTDAEGEGLIGKVMDAKYNAPTNWYKLKRYYPVDCVVTGQYKVGEEGQTGKMLGKVSSISVGIYHNGSLHHIGWISAIMDDESALMTPEQFIASGLIGRPVECLHNGLQVKSDASCGYSLRHPRFRRWRDDKSAADCTLSNLIAEIKKGDK
jgi:hypothetical protein